MITQLYEYKSTLRETRMRQKELKEIEEPTPEDKKDIKLYGEMVTSLEYIVRWLERGHEPYPQRTMKNDPWGIILEEQDLDVLGSPLSSLLSDGELTKKEKQLVKEALSRLTKKQKDVYLLHKGEALSYERVAKLLNVAKGTVQEHMRRAEREMQKFREELGDRGVM